MVCRAIGVALLLASLPIAGCGTVANLANPHTEDGGHLPFGGVKRDVTKLDQAAHGAYGYKTPPKDADQHPQVVPALCAAVDLPFSLVGDVLTWPYTATFTFINQPIQVPPMVPGPNPPVQQGALGGQPPALPLETLPEPKTMP
jgi:uncharacterized protein YceK